MKRILLFLISVQFSSVLYGQIIADHTVVNKFDEIPQYYIDEVKKMWLVVAGESHSEAYRVGLSLLESSYPTYDVNVVESGTPEAYETTHLRASRATWGDYSNSSGWIYGYGEEDWWTNPTAIARTKAGITYCNTHNLTIGAMGFGWCWDPNGGTPSTNTDPVYGCRWYGLLLPQSDRSWGLDAGDNSLTGNTLSMDTYLSVTQEYIDYCTSNGYPTKVFFTTGPVDLYYDVGEDGYQASLKWQHIRNYVKAHPTAILFDYADILCYDDDGNSNMVIWNGHTYPRITAINVSPIGTGHISSAGAIRLAKAMWWMLARMAGWNGTPTGINDFEEETSSSFIEMTNDEIRIRIDDSFLFSTVNLYNLSGSLVATKKTDSNSCVLDISHLSTGVYVIVISNQKSSKTQRIVIA